MNAQSGPEGLLLVVDDEPQVRAALVRCLQEQYEVLSAASGREALALLEQHDVDLILSDQRMPDMSGVEFFAHARLSHPEVLRILITGYSDPDDMIRSINEAAVYQFVAKPWQPEHLLLTIQRALEGRQLARRHRLLSRELKFADDVLRRESEGIVKLLQDRYRFDRLIFASEAMAQVCNAARKAALTELPVLIAGEPGTGKALMARAIHFSSPRRAHPFMVQRCAALADEQLHSALFGHKRGAFSGAINDHPGLLQSADGGTVFLDEVCELPTSVQMSLLRYLQEGEIQALGSQEPRPCNVRIIAACSRPLQAMVDQGSFRQDLYFRLRGFEVEIPPLRERSDDIPVLAEHLAEKQAEAIGRKLAGISAEVLRRLKAHPLPGNVRELEHELQRMVANAEEGEFLSVRHMSAAFARLTPERQSSATAFLQGKQTLKQKVESLEAELVSQALLRHKWNHSRAARELGLSRVGLANKIKRYQLDRKQIDRDGEPS